MIAFSLQGITSNNKCNPSPPEGPAQILNISQSREEMNPQKYKVLTFQTPFVSEK